MEFFEFGFDDFRDCRDGEVIMGRVAGDLRGSVEVGTKDFGCVECLLAWPHISMP